MDDTAARRKFGVIYDQHRRAVLAYCRRRAGADDAEEVLNATFAVAWRRIDNVPEPAEALPWLYSTARGQLSNHRRGRQRFARLVSRTGSLAALPQPDPETQIVRRQELDDVAVAFSSLRPGDQEVLRLAVWEELSHAAIGEVMGISETAVSKRVSRATKRLAGAVDGTRVAQATRVLRKGGAV